MYEPHTEPVTSMSTAGCFKGHLIYECYQIPKVGEAEKREQLVQKEEHWENRENYSYIVCSRDWSGYTDDEHNDWLVNEAARWHT